MSVNFIYKNRGWVPALPAAFSTFRTGSLHPQLNEGHAWDSSETSLPADMPGSKPGSVSEEKSRAI